MRIKRYLLSAAAAAAITACDRGGDNFSPTSSSADPRFATGFVTSQPAQALALLPQAQLKPIITVGDPIPGQESNADPEQRVWAPIPDGLGGYPSAEGLVLFANHEITSGGVLLSGSSTEARFHNARVSRLILDPASLSVQSGSYPITGTVDGFLFQRLCSATFAGPDEGFGEGWFFTGEESVSSTGGGMQLAVKSDGSETRKLPWLGRIAHENYISVPGFGGKLVMIGTDDNSPAGLGTSLRSELYMYVAANQSEVLNGTGKLYVFTAPSQTVLNSGYLQPGTPLTGSFVEVTNPSGLLPNDLQAKVDGLNPFKFVRLEDVDYDHRPGVPGQKPNIYFVDTGNINAQCGGTPCDLYGSIYRMEFDPSNPTSNARVLLLARSRGVAAGDWASPDNIAAGRQSLMVQEDPAYSGFNRPERIWNFKFQAGGGLGPAQAVVELKTEQLTGSVCSEAAGTCWESSGIIDASEWLGEGTWLFDVQAHTLPWSFQEGVTQVDMKNEGGQLLYLRLPGS
jgi:Alkaline phosphatase PhoX